VTEQEIGILADLAAQCAVPIANSAMFARTMATAAKRTSNAHMMAGLPFPEALAAMTAHIKSAVSAECARVLLVESGHRGGGGEGGAGGASLDGNANEGLSLDGGCQLSATQPIGSNPKP